MKTVGSVTTYFVYDAWGNLAADYTSPAAARVDPCLTQTCYVTTDYLGSTRAITDSSGTVSRRYDYLPFGEEIQAGLDGRTTAMGYQTDTDGVNPKFTGQIEDAETGLYYFNARYYSPALGRFTTPDPENVGASIGDTQSWNGYGYVSNTPLTAADPSGLATIVSSGCPADNPSCLILPGSGGSGGGNTGPPGSGPPSNYMGPGAYFLWPGGGMVHINQEALDRIKGIAYEGNQRREWLNNITSQFGYDQRIDRPSCFVDVALATAVDDMNPFTPDVREAAGALVTSAFRMRSLIKFNRAISYAASKPLPYPNKSTIFRPIMKASTSAGKMAAKLDDLLPVLNLDFALGHGLLLEYQAMKRGDCQ